MINRVVATGRLTDNPELRTTSNGISVCSFRIAVERNYSQNGEKKTDFFNVVAWRSSADFVCRYFKKGQMIGVDGHLETREYEDNQGKNRVVVEIIADNVSFCGSKEDKPTQESFGFPTADESGFSVEEDDGLPF